MRRFDDIPLFFRRDWDRSSVARGSVALSALATERFPALARCCAVYGHRHRGHRFTAYANYVRAPGLAASFAGTWGNSQNDVAHVPAIFTVFVRGFSAGSGNLCRLVSHHAARE